MARHYLDHASTSPVRPEATEAMISWLQGSVGDPARIRMELGCTAEIPLERTLDDLLEYWRAQTAQG